MDDGIFTPVNDIGAPPSPTTAQLLPPNPDHVVKAIVPYSFQDSSNNTIERVIIREQYWRRSPESYSLAPGQSLSLSVTEKTGVDTTSSTSVEVGLELGMEVSGKQKFGWGEVAAKITGKLETKAKYAQQVVISSEETVQTTQTWTNTGPNAKLYLVWELIDEYTIVTPNKGNIRAVFSLALEPTIVQAVSLGNTWNILPD